MRASLDTNVIIHLYRAELQGILFDLFDEGVFIYEQIRSMELEHHGQDILTKVDSDINAGKIELFTDQKLKDLAVYKMFENNVRENRILYNAGDLGEVYAISLAQTIGAYSLVTDDTKQGGPYMSLLQLDYDIMGRFDFVVYEKQGRSELPILAIELDGKEHFEDAVVKERDRKKNAICKAHNMEIIRVENSYARRYNHIKGILMDYFSRVH